MPSIFAVAKRIAIRSAWVALLPTLIVCSGGNSTGTTVAPPGTVSDLGVSAIANTSITLSFTQVDDGTGQPANYDVRYSVAPMAWGSASSTASGTCATPLAGTGVGGPLTCSILGLSPSTTYNFQLIAFRGALQGNAVFGGRSNVASASTPTPAPVVTTVTVAPASPSIAVGANATLQATVNDAQGNVMSGQSVSWSSNNTAAATVNASGVVTGVAAGSATITAMCAGKSGSATVTVTSTPPPPPVVTTVTVAPSTASIVAGATAPLSATVRDAQGNVMTGQTIVWSTSNAAAATVNANGVVTAVGAGSATITATCSGKTGSSAVTVTAPPPPPVVTTVTVTPAAPSIVVGAGVTLQATVKDAQGNVMTGQSISWSTNNAAAATVSSGGVATGVAAGSATITATCSGKTGSSTVTVTAPSSGGTLLFEEDFEDTNLASRGWYDNTGAVLSTTEHIAGSNSSAQYRFLAAATIPTSGNAQRHKFTPTNSFYVSYYVKYSTNWVGSNQTYHPHEFYAMSNLDGDWDGPSNAYLTVYLEQNYQNGGKPAMYIQDNKSINTTSGAVPNNLVGVTENRSTSGCNGISESPWSVVSCYNAPPWYNAKGMIGPVVFQPNPGTGYKNSWNFVEAYYQLNTIVNGIGQADGVLQYWFNGALIIDRHDVVYRTAAHPTLQFSQFLIAPYIGDGSPVDQSMFIDNLRVATSRIP
jgi:uncharacterized protein YjdB